MGAMGATGAAGDSVSTTIEPPGDNCPAGGLKVQSSTARSFVCNGADATDAGTSANVAGTLVRRDGSGNFAAGTVTGALVGPVTGNVVGSLTGNVQGNVVGSLTGNVQGNVVGSLTGNVQGNVVGGLTGNVVGGLTGNVVGNLTGGVTLPPGTMALPPLAFQASPDVGLFYNAGTVSLVGGGGALLSVTSSGDLSLASTGARSIAVSASASGPGKPLTVSAGGALPGSSNVAGGDLLLQAGNGTGSGASGNVRLQTAGLGATATVDDLLVDRTIIVAKPRQLTLSAPGFVSLLSIHLTGTQTAGGRIHYVVRATDGASQIATESGVIQYLATANSITCTVQLTDKLHLGTVNSGCTPGFFNPGSQPGISLFDNVTFSSPAPIVVHEAYFTVENQSGSSIRLE